MTRTLRNDRAACKTHLEDEQRIHPEVVKCLVTVVRVAEICLAHLALIRWTCEALQRRPRAYFWRYDPIVYITSRTI